MLWVGLQVQGSSIPLELAVQDDDFFIIARVVSDDSSYLEFPPLEHLGFYFLQRVLISQKREVVSVYNQGCAAC